jgi:hypothetical protein
MKKKTPPTTPAWTERSGDIADLERTPCPDCGEYPRIQTRGRSLGFVCPNECIISGMFEEWDDAVATWETEVQVASGEEMVIEDGD